jgi:hypothetical protein
MINIVVSIITLITAGFLILWILRPSFRNWVERPKYTMLQNDQRFRGPRQAEKMKGPTPRY